MSVVDRVMELRVSIRDLRKAKEPVAIHEEVVLPQIPTENAQVIAISPAVCDLEMEVSKHLFHSHGSVQTIVTYTCSRCLEPFQRELLTTLDERFTEDESEADEEVHVVEGDELDLTPFVEQAVNLEIEYCPVCREDCKGLCSICGCNHNVSECNCETKPLDPRFAALEGLLSSDKTK